MKPLKPILLILFFLLLSSPLQAQFGYPNGRRQSNVPRTQTPPPAPEPQTAEEVVDNLMPDMVVALELNPFEEAVVKSILTKYVKQKMELHILELEPQKIKEAYEKLNELQREELKAGLPEEKFQAYLEMETSGVKKMKKKKKKKKKEKKDKS